MLGYIQSYNILNNQRTEQKYILNPNTKVIVKSENDVSFSFVMKTAG